MAPAQQTVPEYRSLERRGWRLPKCCILQTAWGLSSVAQQQSGDNLLLNNHLITLRPPVPEELPDIAHIADGIEIHIRNHDIVGVALADSQELPARIAKVALAIKL